MSSWFDRGRPKLFQALTSICEQIDRELLDELQQNGRRDANSPEERAGEDIQRLEALSETRHDHHEAMSASAMSPRAGDPTPALGEDLRQRQGTGAVSSEILEEGTSQKVNQSHDATQGHTNWKAEYTKLSTKFKLLSDNFKIARDALQKRKDERDQWHARAQFLEKKVKAAEYEHNIRTLDRGAKSPATERKHPRLAANTSSTDVPVKLETEFAVSISSAEPTSIPGSSNDAQGDAEQGSTQSESDSAGVDLPPMTNTNASEESMAGQHPSSDKVEFVHERSIRKRGREESGSDQTDNPRIKTEPGTDDSSPILSRDQHSFVPQESIDLGESGPVLPTPRKRRLLAASEQDYSPSSAIPSDVSMSFPARVSIKPELSKDRGLRVSLMVDSGSVIPRSGPPQTSNINNQPAEKDLGRGIAFLAEDGAAYTTENTTMALPTPTSLASVSRGRLDTLLNSPSPANWDPITRPGRQIRRNKVDDGRLYEELSIPRPRELPFEKSTRQIAKHTAAQSFQSPRTPLAETSVNVSRSKQQQALQKSGTSLRSKPLSALRLEDFKINPLVNDGQDFAYADVIRNKDERACLSGCVDMHCCGKQFRALALSQRPNPPLTAAQRLEEQTLIESHLGDDAYRLATMSKEERVEVWLDAKTQELANKYGKHRHRYSRMRSPPGFWDADFPSTQELEANKAESAQRQKKTIQERYREAMRPGGRWLFRDE